MSKRVKKNRKRISLIYHLDNPRDEFFLELIERSYEHSAFSDVGLSLNGFCKWAIHEFLLRMEAQMIQEMQAEGANEQPSSDEPVIGEE